MDSWKQYVFSIISCAFSCGIISQILPDPKRKAMMHLVCGTALAITILRPLSGIRLEALLLDFLPDQSTAEIFIQEGEETADEAKEEYIKAACEAYILDKAKMLGTQIMVQVSLNESLIPAFVEIKGASSPNVQTELQRILTEDLGIPKENQTWIWNQENSSS